MTACSELGMNQTETYERMERVDPVRAERVVILTIRRHRDAKLAFMDLLARAKAQVLPVDLPVNAR
jgi:hypothetical protein